MVLGLGAEEDGEYGAHLLVLAARSPPCDATARENAIARENLDPGFPAHGKISGSPDPRSNYTRSVPGCQYWHSFAATGFVIAVKCLEARFIVAIRRRSQNDNRILAF